MIRDWEVAASRRRRGLSRFPLRLRVAPLKIHTLNSLGDIPVSFQIDANLDRTQEIRSLLAGDSVCFQDDANLDRTQEGRRLHAGDSVCASMT